MNVFETYESEVRAYSRDFPVVFSTAKGATLYDEAGNAYIDFFAGAGALNYGHNDPGMKEKLIDYIAGDGVTHSLDMASTARGQFLERFHEVILKPRGFDYKVMFPGPTGTNTVEAALKLARKVTGRRTVVSFTNAFHGMTLGALAATGNAFKRGGAGTSLDDVVFMPFDGYMDDGADTLAYFERALADGGSGLDHPAAAIVETVQGEGGLNTASTDWLKRLAAICRAHDMLLIVDDVQAGCGRTGTFFSFEPAEIEPDIVCLSKSIGGYGLPMALTLIKPAYDRFAPGEHNGTFRGNNPAFVTATEALRFWQDDSFAKEVQAKAETVHRRLTEIVERHPELKAEVRGRGLMQGIAVGVPGLADEICHAAFERGLIMETSGPDSEVAKAMPPLVISREDLEKGLDILTEAVVAALSARAGEVREVA